MKSSPNSQRERILEYLREGNSITSLQALDLFDSWGGFRARLSELRKEGYDIKDEFIKTESNKLIKRYWLEMKPEQLKLL